MDLFIYYLEGRLDSEDEISDRNFIGNCAHPTTRDCIKALELIFAREVVASVLDLGTRWYVAYILW